MNDIVVPVGSTAQRPSWDQLPAFVRDGLQLALGSALLTAASQNSGFTPGFASRIELADGRRYFVKAANRESSWLADAYATETEILALLPIEVPAPRVQYRLDLVTGSESWLVVVYDDVSGRPPRRPWQAVEAHEVLAAASEVSRLLTPVPAGREWAPFVSDFEEVLSRIEAVPADLEVRVGALVRAAPSLLVGNSLVHGDLRDDNVILADDGPIWFCDWNWPTQGPVWIDAACLAISMVGDGLDPEHLFADCPVLAAADPVAVDALLAILLGYFCANGARPRAEGSPFLRPHQRWYAEVIADWLRRRWRDDS